ncbi:TetR/AcrR family transcriptional regulator [Nocardia yunnanensis]|uniref:TetR/AcrR family transcriptional regulator n=1 Tax=Nocardia yunnanensis TaxID=2382165 RepID=A0A386ZA54_9NOCA|nr:TetR/AcrR family transcriptional regulator [Nocardia yunnanensis]AYF73495.1 TetR/AcrR family transcriptional regulator [Nocardia yunnanensis]
MALREEKKRATRIALADAAMTLFAEKGFDRVTVAEVARAANVSVNTAFNYFPTKEDLFFDRQDEVTDRLARAVREREPGESAAAALRRAFLDRVRRDDPTLGLSRAATTFWQLIDDSPALQARLRQLGERTESALAQALSDAARSPADDPIPRLAAAALAGLDRALHTEIRRGILAGDDPEEVRARVIRTATGDLDTVLGALADYPASPRG